ncbi:MAG: 30S ribosome-binding factor RbfA [Candidatus Neomarinimicrobiota bacterium]
MTGYRIKRVEDEVKRIVAEIFIKDLRLDHIGLLTVTKVVCSADLREAKIYISIYDNKKSTIAEAMDLIKGHTSFVRGLLGNRLTLRFVPRITFYYDDTQEYVENIERIFQKIHQIEGERQDGLD